MARGWFVQGFFFFLEELVEGFVLHKLAGIAARELCLDACCSSTRVGGTVCMHTRGHQVSAGSPMGFIQWAALFVYKSTS